MVENIAKILVKLACNDLGKKGNLKIIGTKILIPIQKDYITKIEDKEVKEHIEKNLENYFYPYKPDVLVSIDDKPVLEIECKSYTENAMLKRILVDCTLLKEKYPDMKFILLQLESQLGGDYSELKNNPLGSSLILFSAFLQYSFDVSIPKYLLPVCFATFVVVPTPLNGSKIISPLKLKSFNVLSANFSGNIAGCPNFFIFLSGAILHLPITHCLNSSAVISEFLLSPICFKSPFEKTSKNSQVYFK